MLTLKGSKRDPLSEFSYGSNRLRATQFIDMIPLPLLRTPVGSHCKVPRFTGNAGLFSSTDPYTSTTPGIRRHICLWFSKASVPALLQASPSSDRFAMILPGTGRNPGERLSLRKREPKVDS